MSLLVDPRPEPERRNHSSWDDFRDHDGRVHDRFIFRGSALGRQGLTTGEVYAIRLLGVRRILGVAHRAQDFPVPSELYSGAVDYARGANHDARVSSL